MSKTFIAVDRHGNRRLYLGNHLPSWWIRLSLRLHRWTGEPLVKISARLQSTDPSLSPEVGESEGEDARA